MNIYETSLNYIVHSCSMYIRSCIIQQCIITLRRSPKVSSWMQYWLYTFKIHSNCVLYHLAPSPTGGCPCGEAPLSA